MKLLFNVESLRPPVTGVGHYGVHLLDEFLRDDTVESVRCFNGVGWVDAREQLAATSRYLFADEDDDASRRGQLSADLRNAVGRLPGTRAVYEALTERRFSRLTRDLADTLYHEINYIPRAYGGPTVTTVHDLSHLRFPQFQPAHVVAKLDKQLPRTLERVDRVITDSDVVRDEIIEHFKVEPSRVRTVYCGVDPRYAPRTAKEGAAVLDKYGLSHGGYVLLVATLEPRKGFELLFDAWASMPLALREAYPLVLAGSSGWHNRDLKERMRELGRDGTLRHLGWVSSADLPLLYGGAALFVYPSLYEGFGLPVLDAMHSGVPVICRAGTSMAEFSAGDCVLLETDDPGELAQRMTSLLESPEEREAWAQRGLERARQFSWQRCARELADVYREVLQA